MAVIGDSLFLSCTISTKKPSLRNDFHGVSVRIPRTGVKIIRSRGCVRSVLQMEERELSRSPVEEVLGFDLVTERELKDRGFMGLRKTKLVCTIGPACCSLEQLESLALGGMNIARLNMCHNTREWHCDVIRSIKKLNQEKGYCISLMIDTEGSQMHMVDHGGASSVKAEDGSIWLFTTQKFEGYRPFTVQTNYERFSEGITVGDVLVIDGGMASFEVIEKIGNDLSCKCVDPGLLLPRAKLSFWRDGKLVGKKFGLPTLSAKQKSLHLSTKASMIVNVSLRLGARNESQMRFSFTGSFSLLISI
ncbi:hypothetical protein MKW94_028525 [Papaver nudicaule]|uniref:pyruvate kinase n=1 Tax=Papaver nudicaule TaxID=74823 RepID=A0AA41V0F6_PAPNU|nr:hypothetical protein [Papaver nudicaule]